MNKNKVIYLDNNATTAVDPEVFEAMRPFFCERYGNPSSIHRFGGSVAAEIEEARRRVADLLGSSFRDSDGNASEIIFTSCGSEGDNAAINAAVYARPGRNKIVTTIVEHPGVLAYCKELSRRGKILLCFFNIIALAAITVVGIVGTVPYIIYSICVLIKK